MATPRHSCIMGKIVLGGVGLVAPTWNNVSKLLFPSFMVENYNVINIHQQISNDIKSSMQVLVLLYHFCFTAE